MTVPSPLHRFLFTLIALGVAMALANPFCCFNFPFGDAQSVAKAEGWSEAKELCAGKPETVVHKAMEASPPTYVRMTAQPSWVVAPLEGWNRTDFVRQEGAVPKPPPKQGRIIALLI